MITATFAAGQSLSSLIDMTSYAQAGSPIICAFESGDNWTTADMTFVGGSSSTSLKPILDKDGAEYTVKIKANILVLPPIADLAGVKFLKLRSGTSTTPVNQANDTQINVYYRVVR